MQHRVLRDVIGHARSELEKGPDAKLITIIVPVRLSPDRLYDEVERLDRIFATVPGDCFGVMLVDYGTCAERRKELDELLERHAHVALKRVDVSGPFSIGRARDIGVQHARSKVVMFQDMDLIGAPNTYRRIHAECIDRELASRGYDFFCVPAIFLTESGSKEYLLTADLGNDAHERADRAAFSGAIDGQRGLVQEYATATSVTVINRYYYLFSGGHDPVFAGHGAEDFEFYHRIESFAPRAPRPPRYYENIPLKSSGYNGFRAYFAIFGLDLWLKGIALVHLHHPRREMTDATYRKSQDNFALAVDRMRKIDAGAKHRPPLPDLASSERTLVLGHEGSLAVLSLRGVLPALGSYQIIPESAFKDPASLVKFSLDETITQVLFFNPYANASRFMLYCALKDAGIRTIVFERGALPDSWFFDRSGFLGHSSSYDPEHWDHPLTAQMESRTLEQIHRLRTSDHTLEENGRRQGPDYWRTQLDCGSRKVIFVALQRPADTATRWLAGPVNTAGHFNEWVQLLTNNIDQARYVVVVKKHPLEVDAPKLRGAVYAPDDAHVHDLIELADKIVCINSGVGLLGLLLDKAVIVCGKAFYHHPGLAVQANSPHDLISLASQDISIDRERVLRFAFYLFNVFYSFGRSHYRKEKEANGSFASRVYRIDFDRIAQLTAEPIEIGVSRHPLSEDSFILKVAGYSKAAQAKPLAKAALPSQQSPTSPTPFPTWGLSRSVVHLTSRIVLNYFLSKEDRSRLARNPIDFFKKAKWGPNRFFGRILLDNSQRPY